MFMPVSNGGGSSYTRNKSMAEAMARFQPVQNGGLAGALAQGLAGLGGGYFSGKTAQAETEAKQKLSEVLASGNMNDAINFMATSEIPEYQQAGLKSRLAMAEKANEKTTMAEAYNKFKETGDISALAIAGVDGATIKALTQKDTPEYKVVGNSIFNPKDESFIEGPAQVEKPPAGYRAASDGQLTYIPGGPADPKNKEKPASGETTKVASLVNQGMRTVNTVGSTLFDEGGQYKPGAKRILLEISSGMPISNAARQFNTDISAALEAKLRLETGAAATEGEISRLKKTYLPSPMDDSQTAQLKLQRLNEYFQDAGSMIEPGRQPQQPAAQPQPGSLPQPGIVEDGYRFKGGNPADPNSWEPIQ